MLKRTYSAKWNQRLYSDTKLSLALFGEQRKASQIVRTIGSRRKM